MYLAEVMRAFARELCRVGRAQTPTHEHLRDRLAAIAVATIAVDVVCAVLALVVEHDAAHSQITNFGSAIFWTTTQLLTVSSSLINPISTPGRILDVAMEAYAVVVVAGLAGAMGSFMVNRSHERRQPVGEQDRGPGCA